MPGSCHHPCKPSSSRSSTPSKAFPSKKRLMAASVPGEGRVHEKAQFGRASNVKNLRVRVICTDPDATDSSSDDEAFMKRHSARRTAKRVVRELILPPSFSISVPSCRHDGVSRERHVEMKSHPMQRSSLAMRPSIPDCGKHVGVKEKRCGEGVRRLRLGTSGSPEAAAHAHNEAAVKMKGSVVHFSKSLDDLVGDEGSCLTQDMEECLDDSLPLPAMADTSGPLLKKECAVPFTVSTPCSSDTSVALPESGDPGSSCLFMNSPLSVLGPVSEHSDSSILLSMRACCNRDPLDSHIRDISSDEFSVDSVAPGMGYIDGSLLGIMEPSIPSFAFIDSLSCFDELGKEVGKQDMCVVEEEVVADTRVQFGSNYGDGAGDFSDMDFELDREALAWINGPEATWV